MWFGRKRRRQPAPSIPASDARQVWQAEDMAAALKIPEHILLDTADVSAGSRGYSLHALERAGLMRIERITRESPTAVGGWRFTLTARAQRYADRQAKAAAEPVASRRADNERIQGQAEEGPAQAERFTAEPEGPAGPTG